VVAVNMSLSSALIKFLFRGETDHSSAFALKIGTRLSKSPMRV